MNTLKAILLLPINLVFELIWLAKKLENKNKRIKILK